MKRVYSHKWNEDIIIEKLNESINEIGHFPTAKELCNTNQKALMGAIQQHGGINKFRTSMGYKIQAHANGYWTLEKTTVKLKEVIEKLGYFPSQNKLAEMKEYGILCGVGKFGGLCKFKKKLGYGNAFEKGYWKDKTIIENLQKIIVLLERFPTNIEIEQHNHALLSAIYTHGGIIKYRLFLGYDKHVPYLKNKNIKDSKNPVIYKRTSKWNDSTITENLKNIIDKTGYFPTQEELYKINSKLTSAIGVNGGINKFRKILKCPIKTHENRYWSRYNIIHKLNTIILLYKRFPTWNELRDIDAKLLYAIHRKDGINYYRKLFEYKIIKIKNGSLTYAWMKEEIKNFIDVYGYFPSICEMSPQLKSAVNKHGGTINIQRTFGFCPDYRSEYSSYIVRRGKKTENILLEILKDYCYQKGLKQPIINKRFVNNKIIEFICETNKKIGIDVTNTKTKDVIRRKWIDKKYHLFLDELIIVVFSDKFINEDYIIFNDESPENVSVLSINEFLETLKYKLDDKLESKIEMYKSCTYGKRKIL